MDSINTKDRGNCTGCAACVGCCPQGAISLQADERGFLFPVIEEKGCNHCGKCSIICKRIEQLTKEIDEKHPICTMAMKHIDENIHKNSQSGGVFYQLGKMVIQRGGVVFGAAMLEDFSVSHVCITTEEDLHLLQGSKYVQSNMGMVVSKVIGFLKQGKLVLFSGTPCQCAGVSAACEGLEGNLLLVDLICHGVPTPKLWKDYLSYISCKHHGKISDVRFRVCDGSQKKGHEEQFVIGEKTYRTIAFGQLFYSHAFLRDTCDRCRYRKFGRMGDVTLGDWVYGKKTGHSFADSKGVSQVLVNSEKGMQWIELIKPYFETLDLKIDECMQPPLENKYIANANKEEIFDYYLKHGIVTVVKKYGHENILVRAKRFVRRLWLRI